MIRLGINENVVSAGEMQRQQTVLFRNLQSQPLRTKLFNLADVRRSEPAKRLLSLNIQNRLVFRLVSGFPALSRHRRKRRQRCLQSYKNLRLTGAHALEVMLQPNRPKLHHSIHEAAQVELVAFHGPSGVINLRHLRIAKVIGRDLR
jgi:hypothetical protein